MLQDASATLASRQRRAEPTMEELMRMPLRSHQRWDGVRFFEPPRCESATRAADAADAARQMACGCSDEADAALPPRLTPPCANHG